MIVHDMTSVLYFIQEYLSESDFWAIVCRQDFFSPNVPLSDQNAGMMDGLGKSSLEHLGL